MSIPNIISLARLLAVPLMVYLMLRSYFEAAFWLFVAAAVSDAVDGFIAKRMNQVSALGATLDPLADKALLVSVYVTLGYLGMIDTLVVILVVFRDVMIVGGVLLLFVFRGQTHMRPLLISKVNTAAQLFLAALVLSELGLSFDAMMVSEIMMVVVGATTVASGAWYIAAWTRQMANMEGGT